MVKNNNYYLVRIIYNDGIMTNIDVLRSFYGIPTFNESNNIFE